MAADFTWKRNENGEVVINPERVDFAREGAERTVTRVQVDAGPISGKNPAYYEILEQRVEEEVTKRLMIMRDSLLQLASFYQDEALKDVIRMIALTIGGAAPEAESQTATGIAIVADVPTKNKTVYGVSDLRKHSRFVSNRPDTNDFSNRAPAPPQCADCGNPYLPCSISNGRCEVCRGIEHVPVGSQCADCGSPYLANSVSYGFCDACRRGELIREAAEAMAKQLTVEWMTCPHCLGAPLVAPCFTCGGSGHVEISVHGADPTLELCPSCQGGCYGMYGFCPQCNGSGQVEANEPKPAPTTAASATEAKPEPRSACCKASVFIEDNVRVVCQKCGCTRPL